jgi:hypothetical protein
MKCSKKKILSKMSMTSPKTTQKFSSKWNFVFNLIIAKRKSNLMENSSERSEDDKSVWLQTRKNVFHALSEHRKAI